jgi:tyrosine-specific transport protein
MLLYSLLAAYIAASAPLFQAGASALIPCKLPASVARFCLPVAFGSFLYLGTRGVDYMNRLLMIGLIVSYVAVVVFVPAHIQVKNLIHIDFSASLISVPVVLTSFGYHIIIPSLTTYLHHDRRLLRKAILWGSLLPALIYIVWQVIVIGTVPQASLSKAWLEGLAATVPLSEITRSPLVSKGALFFSFFAIVTSFLGVSLSLSDFLIDGLKLKKTWEGRLFAYLLTFMPPLVFVFSLQRGFYLALQYAGVIVALLLGIIPAAMASRLKKHKLYSSLSGKLLIFFVALLFAAVVVIDFLEKKGALQTFISAYLSS